VILTMTTEEQSTPPRLHPLPPLSSLPTSTYPPSSYPAPSFFESSSLVHPALLLPAKRTGQIQKALGDLVFQEPKRKRVYPPEEELDYSKDDLANKKYDPKWERKLVLVRLGSSGANSDDVDNDDGSNVKHDGESDAVQRDKVWQDDRIQSLLEEAKEQAAKESSTTAPPGKCSVRKSHIRLPASPYSLLTVDQVLRQIMPTSDNDNNNKNNNGNNDNNGNPIIEEIPSSFEIAGHIAHVNLREESLPYKYLIGKAILDKNRPKIKMVVNKIGTIENEFRTFPMEILAGDGLDLERVERLCAGNNESGSTLDANEQGAADSDDPSKLQSTTFNQPIQIKIGPRHQKLMQVEVKEHGCRFQLDFAKVYFNSRLQSEHARLVQQIVQDAMKSSNANHSINTNKECIVADAMAGVGPFAVPLTSANASHFRKVRVVCHANDLNPVSYRYLQTNAKRNKCFSDRLQMYNLDARHFIQRMNEQEVDVDHFIMNLPQLAPEFLDAFRGWRFHHSSEEEEDGKNNDDDTDDNTNTKKKEEKTKKRPTIHVHCFGEKARTPEDTSRVECQVRQRCEAALGSPNCLSSEKEEEDAEFSVRVVRDVGPRKNMLCVSFRLPLAVEGVEKLKLETVANSNDNESGGTDEAADNENGNNGSSKRRYRGEEEGEATGDGEIETHCSKRQCSKVA